MKMKTKMEGRYKGDATRPGIETDMIHLGTTLEFSKHLNIEY